MNDLLKEVALFNDTLKPIKSDNEYDNCISLIREELNELKEEHNKHENRNIALIKELSDLVYVILGAYHRLGFGTIDTPNSVSLLEENLNALENGNNTKMILITLLTLCEGYACSCKIDLHGAVLLTHKQNMTKFCKKEELAYNMEHWANQGTRYKPCYVINGDYCVIHNETDGKVLKPYNFKLISDDEWEKLFY